MCTTLDELRKLRDMDQLWKILQPRKFVNTLISLVERVNQLEERLALYEQVLGRPEELRDTVLHLAEGVRNIARSDKTTT